MMSPENRYFFDLTGYLHLSNVLSAEELKAAQKAADRYINMAPEEWPPEFGADLERRDLTGYQHGFAFDKSLEALTRHPTTWPILMELTDRRPRLNGGTLGHNHHRHIFHKLHAGWQPSKRPDVRRYYVEDSQVRCTDFVFFFYLTDVFPGDGGLIVLPGSHMATSTDRAKCSTRATTTRTTSPIPCRQAYTMPVPVPATFSSYPNTSCTAL